MKKTNTTKALLAGAAIAGLMSGSAARVHAATTFASTHDSIAKPGVMASETGTDKEPGMHACKGQNACKGQGGCKSGDNGCKGKNSCKGHGGCATDGSMENEEEQSE